MKRISIVDATEEQIIEYIKNNPDSWTLGELIDKDEQVYRATEEGEKTIQRIWLSPIVVIPTKSVFEIF